MTTQVFYNGILYTVEYQPQLSNSDYTQRKVYHIKTDDENYPHAKRAIASIMEDKLGYEQGEIWSEGLYQILSPKSLSNALHVHYKFKYNEELDVYVYTFIRPYDD